MNLTRTTTYHSESVYIWNASIGPVEGEGAIARVFLRDRLYHDWKYVFEVKAVDMTVDLEALGRMVDGTIVSVVTDTQGYLSITFRRKGGGTPITMMFESK